MKLDTSMLDNDFDLSKTFQKNKERKIKNILVVDKLYRIMKFSDGYSSDWDWIQHNRYYKHATRIDTCSEYTSFLECDSCGSWHYGGTQLCKSRFCRVCAWKRSLLYIKKYAVILTDFENKGYDLYFGTFTLKSMKNLQEMLNRFNRTLKTFRKDYPIWRDYWDGALLSREITYNPDEGWHVHIHMIMLTKHKFKKRELEQYNQDLSSKWLQKTGDSFITQVKKCRKKKNKEGASYNTHLLELFKYITDLDDLVNLSDKEFKIVFDTLYKRRLISTIGILYHYKLEIETEIEEDMQKEGIVSLVDSVCAICGSDQWIIRNYVKTVDVDDNKKIYKLKRR